MARALAGRRGFRAQAGNDRGAVPLDAAIAALAGDPVAGAAAVAAADDLLVGHI